jgi:hypothetical protein
MVGRCVNLVGEPSNILIEAEALNKIPLPFGINGRRMRFLTDVALYTNFMASGFKVVGTSAVGSAFRKHDGQTSNSNYIGHVAGIFEWELIGRWATDNNQMSLKDFIYMRKTLYAMYRLNINTYPILKNFISGLECIKGTPLLDSDFEEKLYRAYALID